MKQSPLEVATPVASKPPEKVVTNLPPTVIAESVSAPSTTESPLSPFDRELVEILQMVIKRGYQLLLLLLLLLLAIAAWREWKKWQEQRGTKPEMEIDYEQLK